MPLLKNYGAHGVTVNTGVCGTLNLSSILSEHPVVNRKEIVDAFTSAILFV